MYALVIREWRQANRTPDSVLSVICLAIFADRGCDCPWRGGVTLPLNTASPLRRESVRWRALIPPALLPVGHSPSRRSRLRRWWAFAPPFQPSPRVMGGVAPPLHEVGLFSVAVVVNPRLPLPCQRQRRLGGGRPHLLFREATAPLACAQGRGSGSSSHPSCGERATDRLLALRIE